ncbi:hypothetical protein EZJ19_06715 [Parasulfuritortus cantonensis]|uniref:Cation transporter n=1 Tax=Parasulfuritortus cantonensis TaxID=2528202 RepID=A0A4R1BET3_9PROT|nr:hypothetical protein [Parasulfuritortus cantonensis]TCJ15518.1 hypothetical protein EZJ19_06715 [Parasulfuritortus cantonensis]
MTDLDLSALPELRRHLTIVHHLPGRIRLRFGSALWGRAAGVDRSSLQRLLDALEGIQDVRLNAAVASIVIRYDPEKIDPRDWETLVSGDTASAGELMDRWLARYGHLLGNTQREKEFSDERTR